MFKHSDFYLKHFSNGMKRNVPTEKCSDKFPQKMFKHLDFHLKHFSARFRTRKEFTTESEKGKSKLADLSDFSS